MNQATALLQLDLHGPGTTRQITKRSGLNSSHLLSACLGKLHWQKSDLLARGESKPYVYETTEQCKIWLALRSTQDRFITIAEVNAQTTDINPQKTDKEILARPRTVRNTEILQNLLSGYERSLVLAKDNIRNMAPNLVYLLDAGIKVSIKYKKFGNIEINIDEEDEYGKELIDEEEYDENEENEETED